MNVSTVTTAHAGFGPLLRRFRTARGLSQERLAGEAEVSARHLSFLENGRSSPSREMVLILGSALDLPLRDRNSLLVAAGYAAVYGASPIDAAELAPIRRALDHLLRAHEPFGAVVVDRDWNVMRMNDGAQRMLSWALEGLAPPPEVLGNALRATMHPDGLRSRIVNWDDMAAHLIDRTMREMAHEVDESRRARMAQLLETGGLEPSPAAAARVSSAPAPSPVLMVHLRKGDEELRLFTTITTLGTPIDVTAQELRIESYFPADEPTERLIRRWATVRLSSR